jgi:hypothetical protein
MATDWTPDELAALDAAESEARRRRRRRSSSSSSSSSSNDIASAQDINDALKRTQSALAKMQGRNHAGSSGRWCYCDTARLHFFRNTAVQLIQRGQLDLMSEH